eukprot:8626182-Pyramimonas_sp.AAC.2
MLGPADAALHQMLGPGEAGSAGLMMPSMQQVPLMQEVQNGVSELPVLYHIGSDWRSGYDPAHYGMRERNMHIGAWCA